MSRAVAIIDAVPAARAALRDIVGGEPEVTATAHADAADAMAALAGSGGAILLWSIRDPVPTPAELGRVLGPAGPVRASILLTDTDNDAAIDAMIAAGADDVLERPIRSAKLLSRLRRLIRETPVLPAGAIAIGPYVFDVEQRALADQGGERRIRLTEKEVAILLHLYRAGGPVERTTLLHEVWGYNDQVSTHTLETHIYKLRQKIEANPSDARLLLTEGGGYRLAT